MLTNTLLLYVTQEAWAKARARLIARNSPAQDLGHGDITAPQWLDEAERLEEGRRRGHASYRPTRIKH